MNLREPSNPKIADYFARHWPTISATGRLSAPEQVQASAAPGFFLRSGPWDPWEESILIVAWPRGTSVHLIAKQVNRSPAGVAAHANRLGLKRL